MFKSIKYCEDLQAAEFSEKQAKAAVRFMIDAIETNAVTKTDLTLVKQSLEHEIKGMELRLTIKMGAMLGVCMALLASFLKVL